MPPGWRLLLWVGGPLAFVYTLAAAVAGYLDGGPLVAAQLGGLALGGTAVFVGGLIGLIGLVHVLKATRAGAIPLDDARALAGYPVTVELGGSAGNAFDRALAAVGTLSGARVVASDREAGTFEARADGRRFGDKAEHVLHGQVVGTVATCTVRHDDARRPLDFGSTRKQADALRDALAAVAATIADAEAGERIGARRAQARTEVERGG